jgi:hypothetical protein
MHGRMHWNTQRMAWATPLICEVSLVEIANPAGLSVAELMRLPVANCMFACATARSLDRIAVCAVIAATFAFTDNIRRSKRLVWCVHDHLDLCKRRNLSVYYLAKWNVFKNGKLARPFTFPHQLRRIPLLLSVDDVNDLRALVQCAEQRRLSDYGSL